MTIIFIVFLLFMLLLAILVFITVRSHRDDDRYGDEAFLNKDGDHCYYDRGLIEKKKFKKEHPDIKGVRTFRRLFGSKPEDKI